LEGIITMELTFEEKGILLKAARQSIQSVFGEAGKPEVDLEKFSKLKIKSGAFVTLTINNNLRGCIGYIFAENSIYETVCEAAVQAAFRDPRFLPLSHSELGLISIEVSVLSVPEKINSYDEVRIGKHGLILNHMGRRGLLLPQVATENNFNLEKFLCAICEKAGFEPYLWQKQKLSIEVFTAEIFSEEGERKRTYVSD
jgi:AmmeMemoRadiSam system protein A